MYYNQEPCSAVMSNEELTPFEFSLTEAHKNTSTLTLAPRINPKKAIEVKGDHLNLSQLNPNL